MGQETRAATLFSPARQGRAKRTNRFVQLAPGPETPQARDKAGAQHGMLIMLASGAAFWGGVAATVALLAG
ncbi:hypothetical protein [Phenylobacterium deserti]|uniref:Uncharacterized protein n=1 Tax=Phenylobacterium deserti TaxID=1914756 RepID=A0A328AD31_9CAUL|nr:hypothetical protein [Phenylobacterium deserti]RAK52561.1 hypothetical protein DJ018_10125 [Phenylobacterium deserti]